MKIERHSLLRVLRVVVVAGVLAALPSGEARANLINRTHLYTNTAIASVMATHLTQDGDVILVSTNVQTEPNISIAQTRLRGTSAGSGI